MKRLLDEPLVHFLALGAVLFAIGIVRGEPATPSGTRIAITEGHIERLLEGFRMTWNRPPTEAEFRGIVQEHLKEEVLYREALGMGLDQDDQIIRRRLRQKLEFMTADFVGTVEPTEDELEAYLSEHAERYRSDGRLRFAQVFVGSVGSEGTSRAEALLARLRAEPDQDIGALTDPFLHPLAYPDVSEQELRSVYGPDFAELMMQQPVGEWSGPVPSPFGLHLVHVDDKVEGELPALDAVRAEVYRDLMFLRTREAEQAYFDGLLEQYTVTVEWPEGMEPVDLPGVAR
jgi:hypothetical protein